MEDRLFDVLIVGGGVVGAFIARELSKYQLEVLNLEAHSDVGMVTSSANSAIIHSGYDPKPGTLKARLNVRGAALYPLLAQDLDLTYKRMKSWTLAFSEEDVGVLKELKERGFANGVKTRLVTKEEILKEETHVSPDVVMALEAEAALINPFTLVSHVYENAIDNGLTLKVNEEVTSIKKVDDIFVVGTKKSEYRCKTLINASGLNSKIVANLIEEVDWDIKPRKGEYYLLDHFDNSFLNHILFPLPSSKGKGVLVLPTTSNNYLVGPSSEYVEELSDFATDKLTLDEVKAGASRLVKDIPFNEVIRVFSGLRASSSRGDFIIEESKSNKGLIHVAGIESPGLASAPAIGEYVVNELVSKCLKLTPKESFNPKIKPYIKPLALTKEEQEALFKENSDYAQMLCGCEKVTLGEVKDILSRSVPTNSYKALKLRSRAGFGKCGSSFCELKVRGLLKHKRVKDENGLTDFYEVSDDE